MNGSPMIMKHIPNPRTSSRWLADAYWTVRASVLAIDPGFLDIHSGIFSAGTDGRGCEKWLAFSSGWRCRLLSQRPHSTDPDKHARSLKGSRGRGECHRRRRCPGSPCRFATAQILLSLSLALRLSPCHSSRAHRATHTTHADTSAPAPRTLSLYVLYASKSNRASRGRWGPQ